MYAGVHVREVVMCESVTKLTFSPNVAKLTNCLFYTFSRIMLIWVKYVAANDNALYTIVSALYWIILPYLSYLDIFGYIVTYCCIAR